MKFLFTTCILLLSAFLLTAQTNITCTIKDAKQKSLAGWIVLNTNTNTKVITDANGKFTIAVNLNDVLNFSNGMLTTQSYIIENSDLVAGGFTVSLSVIAPRNSGAAITSKSYWVGATIGYNLEGKSSEDIVGSAKIVINPMEEKLFNGEGGIVGNFSNFQAKNDSTNQANINKVTQSTQGLFLGLSDLWTLSKDDAKCAFRLQFTTGARLNAFSDVGPDSTNESLVQFRNSLALELEGLKFQNGGVLNFSTEVSLSFFDKTKYMKIFKEKKSALLSVESSVVLPVSKNIGVLFNSVVTPNTHPVFTIGVIFKGNKE